MHKIISKTDYLFLKNLIERMRGIDSILLINISRKWLYLCWSLINLVVNSSEINDSAYCILYLICIYNVFCCENANSKNKKAKGCNFERI